MASVVDICNVALSHIGSVANVSSIDPPDGSPQASYCARFYPIAREVVLEKFDWTFSTLRATLAEVANPSSTWAHAYALPAKVINLISVLPTDALDDYSENSAQVNPSLWNPNYANLAANFYTPQPYELELDAKGHQIILTNLASAVLRYTTVVDDPNNFSPSFVLALSYLLASMLAGSIIKGDAGATKANEMLQKYVVFETIAESNDADHGRIVLRQAVPWMAGR